MILNSTVADILRPSEKSQAFLYNIALVFCGSIFIALSAQIAIGGPVPFTMQTFAIPLIGALFGAKLGCMCVGLYLLEGLAGWPVFSYWRGGFHMLLGPTGGFLVGFLTAAYVTGFLAQRGWDRRFSTTFLAMLAGNIFIYTFGIIHLTNMMGFKQALVIGLYPFIAGSVIKISLAAALLPTGWKLLAYCGFTDKNS
ncbi:MAG: biotin transporter BioY [Sedimentisphaerales bacterium]|nr:biotin transporter BioY [Sedimentisphaerales bacterium]